MRPAGGFFIEELVIPTTAQAVHGALFVAP